MTSVELLEARRRDRSAARGDLRTAALRFSELVSGPALPSVVAFEEAAAALDAAARALVNAEMQVANAVELVRNDETERERRHARRAP